MDLFNIIERNERYRGTEKEFLFQQFSLMYVYVRLSSTYAHIKYEDQHRIALNEQIENEAERYWGGDDK